MVDEGLLFLDTHLCGWWRTWVDDGEGRLQLCDGDGDGDGGDDGGAESEWAFGIRAWRGLCVSCGIQYKRV